MDKEYCDYCKIAKDDLDWCPDCGKFYCKECREEHNIEHILDYNILEV